MKRILKISLLALTVAFVKPVLAVHDSTYVSFKNEKNAFSLSSAGKSAPLLISSTDYPGVIRAFKDLQTDIGKVSKVTPALSMDTPPSAKNIVIAGTIGKSPLLDQLIKAGKIDVKAIEGKWEAFIIQVIKNPMPGVEQALVIAGSDKRGTIYGIYDVSEKIGVSPWYWWSDVPVEERKQVFIKLGRYVKGSPSVKYRGIFLNDEYPNLTRWVAAKFGEAPESKNPPVPKGIANYNSEFYSRIFELLLRIKANYLWPAMWNNAFNEDDPRNPVLADEYGIVMGTSHQEPMLRAQKEWDRRYLRTLGTWNYAKHPDTLKNFWREGIARNKNFESIVTIGLRGANDTEMAPGGPEANRALLEEIVDEQRKILAEEVNPDVTKVPQVWCLYKEVLEFYQSGMRVPDDVTLLWAEDNWGNVRRLPTEEERKRSGGAGIYYHFDYHGGPRNYQWVNTSPLAKIWDQMSLSKQYGADRIWIVNVGHFKGYELPMEYFMDLGWNSDKWTNENINEYTRLWAEREFGPEYAKETAEILSKYTKYNGRRKPELLSPTVYSVTNYQEAERVVADYKAITAKAEALFKKLPAKKRDAFYQTVLFPTKASAIVNEMYVAAGKNMLYNKQGRASTNDMAAETRRLFSADTTLMAYYNRDFAGGKWVHFMDQIHIGYTGWNEPRESSLRAVPLKELNVPEKAEMGIAIEGSDEAWPSSKPAAVLPRFDIFNNQRHYVEVFNKGKSAFNFSAKTSAPWIKLSEASGSVQKDKRIWVSIDWSKVPKGLSKGTVNFTGTGQDVTVQVEAFNPAEVTKESLKGFVEAQGYVSIEAEHFSKNTPAQDRNWIRIEDYGHTLSGMRATAPANAPSAVPGKNAPSLEYRMYLFNTDSIEVTAIVGPTLNFMPDRGLQYAISFDDEAPQIVNILPKDFLVTNGNRNWEQSVINNARFLKSKHSLKTPGYHTLKIWMVDPGVVLQKLIVNTGGLKQSNMGPPESFYKK